MSWTLGATTLKEPGAGDFVREQIEIAVEHTLLSGKTTKNVFGQKERFVIKEQMLTTAQANSITSEFADQATKSFVVTELSINTTVLVSINRKEYNTPGGDLLVDLTLILIEEEAS